MKTNIQYALTAAAIIAIGVLFSVWETKYGSPQNVWLYCDIFKWCHR